MNKDTPNFEGRYDLIDRLIPTVLCMGVTIYCWGVWLGVVTG